MVRRIMNEFVSGANEASRSQLVTAAHFLPNVTSDLRNLRGELALSGEDSIKYRDFIAMMMDEKKVVKEDNLRMVFEHFKGSDKDCILASDVAALVGGEKHALEIMKMVDANSDGRIDFKEFKAMMEADGSKS